MRKLMALGAELPAVASKRRIFARVGLAAALAVSLLWMGGHGAQAGTFNPTWTVSLANTVADTPSDITFQFDIPEGDVWASSTTTFLPTGWQITPSSEVGIGVRRGTIEATPQYGFFNNACNTRLAVSYNMVNATTDKSQTVTYEDAFDDSNGDGNADFIDMYLDFNDRILGPAQPVVREAGVLEQAEVLVQILLYEPGATIAGETLDPALGQPMVTLMENTGDPEAVGRIPPATDDCTPFTATSVTFGTAEDGTVLVKNPKQAGTYTIYVLAVGERDADGDGYENTLDTCPLDPDPTWDPRSVDTDDDPDGDGIPNSCDPTPDENTGASDHDGDGYVNRLDNCPLVANGVADADNQKDSDLDGIGDACDPHPNDADSEGEAPEVMLSQDVTITAAATASPTVAPAATPVATPTPAVTPAPTATPAVKTATPTVVAPSAGGGGFASDSSWPWWPLAIAGAAAAAAGALLAWQAKAGARR